MTEFPRSFEEATRESAIVDEDLVVEKAVVEEAAAGSVELPELSDSAEIVVETGEAPADDEEE